MTLARPSLLDPGHRVLPCVPQGVRHTWGQREGITMSLAQPAEDPSKEGGLSVHQAFGTDAVGMSLLSACTPRWLSLPSPLTVLPPVRWALLCAQVPRPCLPSRLCHW